MSCINSTWFEMFIESTLMRYGHSQGGLTEITCIDKAICPLAHRLHSCSQLDRNLTSMRNELSKTPTHHLEESNAWIQADTLTEGSCGKGNTSALIDATHLVITPSAVFIIVSGKLTAASVNVKNALQIGMACMEAYDNKLPQGFYNVNMLLCAHHGYTHERD